MIALDGGWGSGKSFFLKCWVGYHLKQETHKAETVYFDAFKHDYLDDPLIALTGEIARRFRTEEDDAEDPQSAKKDARVKKLKKSAWAVGKAAGRIGLSAVTFGATEILSDMGDEIAKAAGEEAKAFLDRTGGEDESEKYWDMHEAKIAAMEGFRLALEALTEPATEQQAAESGGRLKKGEPSRKLVIVVDELDRCRPDYALSLLEIIKHFFNVPGVHFVLGMNLAELQNSVRARYGAGIDSERYLQKFITLNMKIGIFRDLIIGDETPTIGQYFDQCAQLMRLENSPFYEPVRSYIQNMQWDSDFSLRALHRMLSAIKLTSPPSDQLGENTKNYNIALVSGLLILAAFDPKAIASIRSETGEMYEIVSALKLEDPREASGQELTNWIAWAACFNHPDLSEFLGSEEKAYHLSLVFGLHRARHLL